MNDFQIAALPLATLNHGEQLVVKALSLQELFDSEVHAVLPAVIRVARHVDALFADVLRA